MRITIETPGGSIVTIEDGDLADEEVLSEDELEELLAEIEVELEDDGEDELLPGELPLNSLN